MFVASSCSCLCPIHWRQVENGDIVGAAPTGAEWSTILLPTMVWLILEVYRNFRARHFMGWQNYTYLCFLSVSKATCFPPEAGITEFCYQIDDTVKPLSHTKSLNLTVSRLVLQLSLPNPFKPERNFTNRSKSIERRILFGIKSLSSTEDANQHSNKTTILLG